MNKSQQFILWFKDLVIEDVPLVGGKNASLGEMYSNLTAKGINVPDGFAITAYSYHYLLQRQGIKEEIRKILSSLNTKNIENLRERGRRVRDLVRHAAFPPELQESIINAYDLLCKKYGHQVDVAVRSSATAEDLPDASFAGQQETYLNIRGHHDLLEACKKCFASLFTNRAISYRVDKHFDHFKIGLSIGVQKMVRSDKACSGVMFSIDTESGFKDVVLINGAYGLGENIVKGVVNPDEYYVFKPTLKKGFNAIIMKNIGEKSLKMVYSHEGNATTRNVDVAKEDRNKYVLADKEILQLAKWGCIIEDYYGKKAGHYKPMDMEWAKDGNTGKLFIVQARPETVQSNKDLNVIEHFSLREKGKVLAKGRSVGERIGQGIANVIKDVKDMKKFKQGQVLVTEMTDPDWEPIMKLASAIVTNRGGRTCHAAIISRELGIPCIVGTNDGTQNIKSGNRVTVSCAEGDEGFIYEGLLKYKVEKLNVSSIPKTRTKVMMNLGDPEDAFALSFLPNDGIGLAREEFIINSHIRIHPKALIEYPNLKDHELKKQIQELTSNYTDKKQFFVDKLASGVAVLAASVYPNDIIVRFSDFKTNEYANLIGGKAYEPKEDNPMIGWRGASRYYNPKFRDCFALECKAIRKAREEMGLHNIKVMIPFCRTVEEGKKVIAEMAKSGLRRGSKGLEVYVMCEIPANVILVDEFSKIFDGFSIGTNDLTQLTLGLDRDSELVANIYDERNAAVKRLVKTVIHEAKKRGRKIGICGDAPSTYPDFARFLVECGIDSISLSPDVLMKTKMAIAREEEHLKRLMNK